VWSLQQPSGTQDQGTCQNSAFPTKLKSKKKNEDKVVTELEKSVSSCGKHGSKSDINSWVKPTGKR
jgi:hypothetical protein